uniref:Uncharacterized protein n=1 Tax=Candidatus Kentrum sp. TC TaxID=2126339 RepID=A0A450YX73_9GAMM|nr:MAG: hypothetical protein BECKTC1821D_GA0114238_102813 [Candidatus Kentron sp. TC]
MTLNVNVNVNKPSVQGIVTARSTCESLQQPLTLIYIEQAVFAGERPSETRGCWADWIYKLIMLALAALGGIGHFMG